MKRYTLCSAVLSTLAINTVIKFDTRSKKRYQIDAKSKDFVYLHEYTRNGQIIFAPCDCVVFVSMGF